MKPDVSVVIPSFDNWDLTRSCLESLRRYAAGKRHLQVIVVDNGSRDGTPDNLAGYSWVEPVLLPRNLGFAAASNLGALQARADLLFFLNNDTLFASDALSPLCEAMESDENIVIAGSRLLYDDGSIQHAGLVALAPDRDLWHVHRHMDGSFAAALVECDPLAVTGAAMMVRRSWFLSAGGFDTAYTNGYEDVDLCFKARADGARVRYVPGSVLYHYEGATAGRSARERQNRALFRSRWQSVLSTMPMHERGELRAVDFVGDVASPTPDSECGLELFVSLRAHVPLRLVGRREETLTRRPDLAACYDVAHAPQCTIGWLCVPVAPGPRIAIVGEHTDLALADDTVYFLALSPAAEYRVRAAFPRAEVRRLRLGVDTAGYGPTTQSKPAKLVNAPFEVLYFLGEFAGAAATAAVVAAVTELHAKYADVGLAIVSALGNEAIEQKCLEAVTDWPTGFPTAITSIAGLKGFVNSAVFCGADAVVFPEPADETPFACLAAMSCARPVIACTDYAEVAPIRESTAAAVPRVAEIAAALDQVRSDCARAVQRGMAARAAVRRTFSASLMGSRIAEIVRNVCYAQPPVAQADRRDERIAG